MKNLRRRAMKIFTASSIEEAEPEPAPHASGAVRRQDRAIYADPAPGHGRHRRGVPGGTDGGRGVAAFGAKVLAPHSAGPSFIERFHREQHILASLDHPNITRMLDAGLSERASRTW